MSYSDLKVVTIKKSFYGLRTDGRGPVLIEKPGVTDQAFLPVFQDADEAKLMLGCIKYQFDYEVVAIDDFQKFFAYAHGRKLPLENGGYIMVFIVVAPKINEHGHVTFNEVFNAGNN
jgi:hypothetical protein